MAEAGSIVVRERIAVGVTDRKFNKTVRRMSRRGAMQCWSLSRGFYTDKVLRTTLFTGTGVRIRKDSVEIEASSSFHRGSRSFAVSGSYIAPFFAELRAMETFSDNLSLRRRSRGVRSVLRNLAKDIRAHPERYRQERLEWQQAQLWPARDTPK